MMPGRRKPPKENTVDELTAVRRSMPKSNAATGNTKKSRADQIKFLKARSAEQRARAKKEAKARADRAANKKKTLKFSELLTGKGVKKKRQQKPSNKSSMRKPSNTPSVREMREQLSEILLQEYRPDEISDKFGL